METAIDKLAILTESNSLIEPELYDKYNVKRGLRNSNGTGVLVGLTKIGSVEGYKLIDDKKIPEEGKLFYRGINVEEIVDGFQKDNRMGFEETTYLLLFGKLPNKTELDDFDLICHIAYDKAPLTKKERAENVKKRHYLYKYSDTAQKVIEALLDKYANDGIKDIEDTKVLELKEFAQIGSPLKIVKAFGGKEAYQKAVQELENEIYYA